jgi:elongator complex protein 3
MLANSMREDNWKCNCIRCREVREKYNPKEKLFLYRMSYEASGGEEVFLIFEDKKRENLHSLLRLRVIDGKAFIREVHTFGQMQSLAAGKEKSPQHRGLGKKLIVEAERMARGKTMLIISGVGVREYYRKLGYRLKDTYMVKKLF